MIHLDAIPKCPIHDCSLDPETGCDHCERDARLEAEQAAEAAEQGDDIVDVEIVWEVDAPGWFADMPEDTYFSDPVPDGSLSASMCKVLIQPGGPAKLRQQLDAPRGPNPVFDIGHAAHKLVLGVGAEIVRIPHDEWRTKEAKAAVQAARDAGQIPLKPADWDRVHAMADQLARHPAAVELLVDAVPEVSAFRRHDSGVWLRSRIDAVGDGYLADFKTSRSADPELFHRDAANLAYHVQDAFYTAMADALDGLPDDPDFYFIVQEKEPPYLVSVVELSPTFRAIGAAAVEHAIDLWQQCQATGEWPGYPAGISLIDPPAWLRSHDEPTEPAYGHEPLDPAIEAAFADLLGETL